jgi:hypothetical protein
MTFSRLHITVFLGLAALAWALALLAHGTPVSFEEFGPFSEVVTFLVLLGVAFEHVLWHQPFLHGWFIHRPDLRGTWRVELRSDWIDPHTGLESEPIEGFVAVTQTLSRLQMQLMTAEAESWLVADRIDESPKNDRYRITAVYTNEPGPRYRGKRTPNEIHHGAQVLDTHGPSRAWPDMLSGEYWTDRGTKGTMKLSNRMMEFHSNFEDAHSAFSVGTK